jgi:Protein of unknown function (DUF3833)
VSEVHSMSSIEHFKGTGPVFLPEQFFNGKIEGWAVVEGLLGGLQKRATITGEGHWDQVTFAHVYGDVYIR